MGTAQEDVTRSSSPSTPACSYPTPDRVTRTNFPSSIGLIYGLLFGIIVCSLTSLYGARSQMRVGWSS